MAREMRRFGAMSGVFAVLTIVLVIWMSLRIGGARLTDGLDDVAELVAALVASIACAIASRRSDRAFRATWTWISASAGAWAVGEAIWTWYDLVRSVPVPFPSAADAGFLLSVPLAIAGLLLWPNAPALGVSRGRTVLDGVIVAGSLLLVSWVTALGTVYSSGKGSILSRAIGLSYPVSDIVIATVALLMLSRSTGRRRVPLLMIVGGMVCLAVADSSFAYLTQLSSFGYGNVVDSGWVAGYLLIALAALWPLESSRGDSSVLGSPAAWQAGLPYLFVACAVVATVWKRVSSGHLGGFHLLAALAVVVAVLGRQVLTSIENRRLTGQLQLAVTSLRVREAELTHHALHDPLTALPNRNLFGDRLDQSLARQRRGSSVVAVLLCDLDSFKDVNDTLGHSAGDEVLMATSQRLSSCVRPSDTVARIGGDEFAIIIDNAVDSAAIEAIAGRVRDAMRPPFSVFGHDFHVHVSIGVAVADGSTSASEPLLRDADVALYASKDEGGDSFTFYDPELGEAYIDRLGLQAELGLAVSNGEMFVEYQPVLYLGTGAVAGVEALVRWRHPRRGVLAPGEFLPIAEESGAIVPIGTFVLNEAVRQLRSWYETVPETAGLFVAVNVSARQLASGDLVAHVSDALGDHDIDPSHLHLELTESALIDHADWSLAHLEELKALGVSLDIDDFGTGYSSLTYLKLLPIDSVKIDRAFVEGLKVLGPQSNGRDPVIVEAIVSLAHALGLRVVAEGVETRSQLEKLRVLGCDLGQGYFWSRPVSPKVLESWLVNHH